MIGLTGRAPIYRTAVPVLDPNTGTWFTMMTREMQYYLDWCLRSLRNVTFEEAVARLPLTWNFPPLYRYCNEVEFRKTFEEKSFQIKKPCDYRDMDGVDQERGDRLDGRHEMSVVADSGVTTAEQTAQRFPSVFSVSDSGRQGPGRVSPNGSMINATSETSPHHYIYCCSYDPVDDQTAEGFGDYCYRIDNIPMFFASLSIAVQEMEESLGGPSELIGFKTADYVYKSHVDPKLLPQDEIWYKDPTKFPHQNEFRAGWRMPPSFDQRYLRGIIAPDAVKCCRLVKAPMDYQPGWFQSSDCTT